MASLAASTAMAAMAATVATARAAYSPVFSVDLETFYSHQYTKPGFQSVRAPSDGGPPVRVAQQDGSIVATISDYTHMRRFGNNHYDPMLADSFLRNEQGTMTLVFANVPPGDYNMVMYHSSMMNWACGGCHQVLLSSNGRDSRTFYRSRLGPAMSLNDSPTMTEFNFTVGGNRQFAVSLTHRGGSASDNDDCQVPCDPGCGRCPGTRYGPGAHMDLNGWVLSSAVVPVTATTTTITETTHTQVDAAIRDTFATLRAERQVLRDELIASMTSMMTSVNSRLEALEDALASTTQTTAQLQEGLSTSLGALPSVDAPSAGSCSGTCTPAVEARSQDLHLGAPGGNVEFSTRDCGTVDICDLRSTLYALTSTLASTRLDE